MARSCTTCEHIKRAEIDRRLEAGESDAVGRELATLGKLIAQERDRNVAFP